MVNRYIFDSNFLVSYIDISDANHIKSVKIFKDLLLEDIKDFYIAKLSIYEVMVSLAKNGYDDRGLLEMFLFLGRAFKIIDLSESSCFRHF